MKTSTIIVVLWLYLTQAQAQKIIEKHLNIQEKNR